ncbi:helix-turn-helix domain-containing protein [Geminisphaera colitermitum]|uniref:helix-turn-helix domain-containing protein n=1 Tax=Geminisphaera colitermitum TaxID=1148786 RepID=UPI000158D5AE|nr:AraC family transcriptional regulator [Geminisphaera colitermitum]
MSDKNYDISGIRALEQAIAGGDPYGALVRLTGTVLQQWREGGASMTLSAHQKLPMRLSEWEARRERHGTSVSCTMFPRFIFVLEGEYRVIHDINDRSADRVVRTGELYWIRPNDWNLVRNDAPRVVFAVSFTPDHTRFLWYHHKREPENSNVCLDTDNAFHTELWYHTHVPVSVALRYAIGLIDEATTLDASLGKLGTDSERQELLHTTGEALLAWCLQELHADAQLAESARFSGTVSPSRRTFDEICAWITERLQHDLERHSVASIFRVSEDHLTRLFRTHAHCGFVEFVRAERFRLAERLLADSRLSIKEVAAACGFSLSAYFIKRFRQQHGLTPAAWRRQQTGMSGANTLV